MSGIERARLLGLLGQDTIVLQRTDLTKRPENGNVRHTVVAPAIAGEDPLDVSIRRLTERTHVRAIDRDSRHMRGFDTWMRGARR